MNREELETKTGHIQQILEEFLPDRGGHTSRIEEAVCYSVRAGGKRLRPLLMEECFVLFGGDPDDPLLHAFMAAIEMIHTYSLVHDDLPAMDDDAVRRGLPTTHIRYGEAFGVLAGDALLNLAYETPLAAMEAETDPERIRRSVAALSVLAEKAGIYGMVGGQCLDVYAEKTEGFETKEEELLFIYENKTAALLEASMMVGGILAGAGKEEVSRLEQIAGYVGLAFQIRDDILDVTGSTEVLGKPAGSDEKNGKTTYLTFKGLSQSEKDVETYSEKAIALLEGLPAKNDFLKELILYLVDREN